MKKAIFLILLFTVSLARAQSARDLNVRAGADYKDKKYGQALDTYLQAQQKDPKNEKLNLNIADSYYFLKEYDKAGDIYGDIAKNAPKLKHDAVFNLGNVYYRQGDTDKAVQQYRQALLDNPKDKDALFNLQLALEKKKQSDNANKNQKPDQKNKDQQNPAGTPPNQSSSPQQQKADAQKKQDMQNLLQMARDQEQNNAQRAWQKTGPDGPPVEKDW